MCRISLEYGLRYHTHDCPAWDTSQLYTRKSSRVSTSQVGGINRPVKLAVTVSPWCSESALRTNNHLQALLARYKTLHTAAFLSKNIKHNYGIKKCEWDEITYPFPKFNGWNVKVWEWISNFISNFMTDVLTNPCCRLKLIHVGF